MRLWKAEAVESFEVTSVQSSRAGLEQLLIDIGERLGSWTYLLVGALDSTPRLFHDGGATWGDGTLTGGPSWRGCSPSWTAPR